MHWTQLFTRWQGEELPVDYLAFDLETTGFKKDEDLPIDIGWVIVRNCKVVHKGNYLLNWVGYPGMNEDWLINQLERVRASFARKFVNWPYWYERLRDEGKPPAQVLSGFLQLLRRNGVSKNGLPGAKLVGQNAWSYDVELITHTFQEILGESYEFGENELYDVGCMEKAIRAGDLEPFPDDKSLKQYFLRVAHANRKGVHWNAADCAMAYHLEDKGVDYSKLHSAGEDAYVSHLLFEEHRQLFHKHSGRTG